MIGRFRRAERWEFVGCGPIEIARVHNDTTRDCAIACQVLCHGVHHQCRAVFDWAAEVGRGRGVVDDQGQARIVGDLRDRIEIGDVAAGVGDGFTENRARVVVDSGGNGVCIIKVYELGRPAETFDRLAELRDRAAIKAGRGNDITAGLHQREQRHDLRCVTGRTAYRANAAFKGCHTFLQHGNSGVRQAGIDVADFLQVKECGCVFGITEHIGCGLVNRGLASASCRIGAGARVDQKRIESGCGIFSHQCLPLVTEDISNA